jgi:hypothetical protein
VSREALFVFERENKERYFMETMYSQEQKHEDSAENELSTWVKPELKVIAVSLECTAYAGAL